MSELMEKNEKMQEDLETFSRADDDKEFFDKSNKAGRKGQRVPTESEEPPSARRAGKQSLDTK